MKKLTIAVLFLLLPISPASAIYGGTDATNDQNVITFTIGKESRQQYCSGAMVTDLIAVTAGHCFAKPFTSDGSTVLPASSYWAVSPGKNIKTDDISTRVQADRIILVKGYDNSWDLATNNRNGTIDDIAFIVLKNKIKLDKPILLATAEDVVNVKKSNGILRFYGYGLYDFNKISDKPNFVELNSRARKFFYELNHPAQESKTIIGDENGVMAICPGDSGGPVYINDSGVLKLVAVISGGSGCSGRGTYAGGSFATLIHPYMYLINDISINKKDINIQLTNNNLPATIKCQRGKSIQTITRKNAKCMRGWSEIK